MTQNLGEVEITLNGRACTLRCSLRAARAVSGMSGGFAGAFDGISRFNFSIYAAIVAAGLDKRTSSELSDIEEDVFKNGLESLVAPLTRYVTLLMHGGREPSADADTPSGNG